MTKKIPMPANHPLIHALGGSLGSSLALLLFFPLERLRIEMQSQALPAKRKTNPQKSEPTSAHFHTSPNNNIHDDERSFSAGSGDSSCSWTTASMTAVLGNNEISNVEDNVVNDNNERGEKDKEEILMFQRQEKQHKDSKNDTNHSNSEDMPTCFRRLWQRGELYRGVAPVVTTMAASNFVFFYFNTLLKRLLLLSLSSPLPPSANKNNNKSIHTPTSSQWSLVISSLAGVCNVLITNPLWVANLRIVTGQTGSGVYNNNNNNTSLLKEMYHIYKTEGLGHLWAGTSTSLLLVANPVIQFFLYEQIRNAVLSSRERAHANTTANTMAAAATLYPLEAFATGAIAKAIATIVTYPMQLAQSVLRLQQRQPPPLASSDNSTPSNNNGNDGGEHETATPKAAPSTNKTNAPAAANGANDKEIVTLYRGTWDCLVKLYYQSNDGSITGGLFRGMKAKLLQTVLTAAFTFLTYEQIIRAVCLAHASLLPPSSSSSSSSSFSVINAKKNRKTRA